MSGKGGIDRRSARTRQLIGTAFLKLGGTTAISSITVKALSKEAGISRSTFYAHYKSIDDYLARSFGQIVFDLASMEEGNRILPVRNIINHVGGAGEGFNALVEYRNFPKLLWYGEQSLKKVADKQLSRLMPGLPAVERRTLATTLAAGFMALLRDWIIRGLDISPHDLSQRFEAIEARLAG